MLRVKVCGLNDPSNVKAISGCGADFIGFNFYRDSSRYVGENPDETLFLNVPAGIMRTGIFVNEDPARVLKLTEFANLDIIQLHGDESVNYCKSLKGMGLQIIKAFGVGTDFDPGITDRYSKACDYFLFDAKHEKFGGTGNKFDWGVLNNYSFRKPFFLSGGIRPDDADKILSIVNPRFFAVDINSGFEISPGIKDAAVVKSFINQIK